MGLMPPWAAARAQAVNPLYPKGIGFRALRDGVQIGHHSVTFEERNGTLAAHTTIEMAVHLGGLIRVFSFRHDSQEIWTGGQLSRLVARTDDDGETFDVEGEATAGGFRVVGREGPILAPRDLPTTNTLWSRDIVHHRAAINAQHGDAVGLRATNQGADMVEIEGERRAATRYRLVTPQCDATLWYDDAGRWIKARFAMKGEVIDYALVV